MVSENPFLGRPPDMSRQGNIATKNQGQGLVLAWVGRGAGVHEPPVYMAPARGCRRIGWASSLCWTDQRRGGVAACGGGGGLAYRMPFPFRFPQEIIPAGRWCCGQCRPVPSLAHLPQKTPRASVFSNVSYLSSTMQLLQVALHRFLLNKSFVMLQMLLLLLSQGAWRKRTKIETSQLACFEIRF